MTVHIDAQALQASLRQLRRAPHEANLARAMERIVAAVERLFGYTGVGIMFITDGHHLSFVAASDDAARRLEEAQLTAGQGPCYEAYVYATAVTTKDVHADSRWPRLADHLDPKVRAVAGVPILLGGSPAGTLNVYRDHPTEWDDTDVEALRAYADLVEELLSAALAAHEQSELADQLQYALDYRVVIERAIGYLMATHGLDAVTAFDLLRKQSRDSRRRVADVAAEVLGETQPLPPQRPRRNP